MRSKHNCHDYSLRIHDGKRRADIASPRRTCEQVIVADGSHSR